MSSGGDFLVELIALWARREVFMSVLQCRGVMMWATILVSISGLLWCRGMMMWATMLVSMSGLLCRGMTWATMLGRRSDSLSVTWWLRKEESWPELLVDWAEWEMKLMFWKTSKDSALWVRNDPAERLDGARVARAEASKVRGRLVVEVWWDTMLLITIPCSMLVLEVAE